MMSPTTCPRIYVETVSGVTIASLVETELLDEDVIRDVDDELKELVEGHGSTQLLLNFQAVRYMSSTMLAVLLKYARRVAGLKGKLKLCCIAPDLLEVFKITRFDRLFEIHSEEFMALDSFAR